MNTTNRAANRLFLLVLGLLLLAAGAVAVLLVALPAFAAGWKQQASAIPAAAPPWISTAAVGSVNWLTIVIGVLAVVLAILLVAFIVRQGHGHAASVLERRNGPTGRTRIDLAVPRADAGV